MEIRVITGSSKLPHSKFSFDRQRSASLSHGFLCAHRNALMGTSSNSVGLYPVSLRSVNLSLNFS